MKIVPDPINWTKASIGSKFKFRLVVFVELLFDAFVIYVFLINTTIGKFWRPFAVVFLGSMLGFHFRYLYALRKIFLELEKREKI
jgi:hypothetical protein